MPKLLVLFQRIGERRIENKSKEPDIFIGGSGKRELPWKRRRERE